MCSITSRSSLSSGVPSIHLLKSRRNWLFRTTLRIRFHAAQSLVHRAITRQSLDRFTNRRRRRFVRLFHTPPRVFTRRLPYSCFFDELRHRHATALGCSADLPHGWLRSMKRESCHDRQVSSEPTGRQAGPFIVRHPQFLTCEVPGPLASRSLRSPTHYDTISSGAGPGNVQRFTLHQERIG